MMTTEFLTGYGPYGYCDYPFTNRCPQCQQQSIQDKTCSECGWTDPMIWETCPSCKAHIRHLPGSSCQLCGYIPGYKKCHYCQQWTTKEGKCEDEECYSNHLPEVGSIVEEDVWIEDALTSLRAKITYQVVRHEVRESFREYDAEYKKPIYEFVSGEFYTKAEDEE